MHTRKCSRKFLFVVILIAATLTPAHGDTIRSPQGDLPFPEIGLSTATGALQPHYAAQTAKLTPGDPAAGKDFGQALAISGDTIVIGAPFDAHAGEKSGAAYVFAWNGSAWAQQGKLTASDAAADDWFGIDVAIDRDTIVVGALRDDAETGDSGSAYVFQRSGSAWIQQAKLLAGDTPASRQFGKAVSISGDRIVVGAWQDGERGAYAGAAYIFQRNGTAWTRQAKLTASDAAPSDFFGFDVAISSDTALIGAIYDDDGASGAGSAYVFQRSGTNWTQQQKLTASDIGDSFGCAVAIDGDTIVVGSYTKDLGGISFAGAAYVFQRSGTHWTQQQKLTASDAAASDQFGWSVAISGDLILVGAITVGKSGFAYAFLRIADRWVQRHKLIASDAAVDDGFGDAVAAAGSTMVIGAPGDDVGGADAGSAYVYQTTSVPPPIVLVHGWKALPGSKTRSCTEGVGRYNFPGVVDDTFGDMPRWFQDRGHEVWIAHLDTGPACGGTPPIGHNAQCLNSQIAYVRQRTGQDVILVAHSMGGLVSRSCLNLTGCRNNVAALYTLGSPHAGFNSDFLLKILARLTQSTDCPELCVWQPAACQFSTDGISIFNHTTPNRTNVDYTFIGGQKTPAFWGLGVYLLVREGPHDGLVGSHSAVGWLWPSKVNAVRGPEAVRFWTDETHSDGVGYPSYFEPYGGPESQAFRCISGLLGHPSSADSTGTSKLAASLTAEAPLLSATTIDAVGHLTATQTASHTFQVDTGDHTLFHLSWLTGTLSLTLTQPGGQVIDPIYAAAHPDLVTYTIGLGGDVMPPSASYALTTTIPGPYTATITAGDVGPEGTNYVLFAALETNRTFSVTTTAELYQPGDTAVFTGTLQGPAGGIAGADVQVKLSRMDGLTETLALADLGGGLYQTTYTVPDVPGYLIATFSAAGDDQSVAFSRQVDKLLAIASHSAQLAGTYADRPEDTDGDGIDDTLTLDVGVTATEVGTYTLSADLVAQEQTITHATEYALLAGGAQTVTLQFDGWDIRRSQLDGPYTVTGVYLLDLGAGGIPAQIDDDVWQTAPYSWRDFGFERFYLPLILKNH